jgi:hypothetical protein
LFAFRVLEKAGSLFQQPANNANAQITNAADSHHQPHWCNFYASKIRTRWQTALTAVHLSSRLNRLSVMMMTGYLTD